MVQQFCDEHPERYLLAFVYGYLGDYDLLQVHTDAGKVPDAGRPQPRGKPRRGGTQKSALSITS